MHNNNSKSQTSPVKTAKIKQNSSINFQIETAESKFEMNQMIDESEHSGEELKNEEEDDLLNSRNFISSIY